MKPTRWPSRGEKWCVTGTYGIAQRRIYRKHERNLRKREALREITSST